MQLKKLVLTMVSWFFCLSSYVCTIDPASLCLAAEQYGITTIIQAQAESLKAKAQQLNQQYKIGETASAWSNTAYGWWSGVDQSLGLSQTATALRESSAAAAKAVCSMLIPPMDLGRREEQSLILPLRSAKAKQRKQLVRRSKSPRELLSKLLGRSKLEPLV